MSDVRYVRLKPYNKQAGHLVKRYHVAGQLFIGADQAGNPKWYKVDRQVAAMLAGKRQNHSDPHSQPVFDVATAAEYKAISLRERDLRLVEMGLASASAVSAGPQHAAEAPLVDRSSGRGGAVPAGEIPNAAAPPAPAIKVDEVGPSTGEPVAPSETVVPPAGDDGGDATPPAAADGEGDADAAPAGDEATTSRRRRS